jgi:hypothetical protein
MEQSNDRSRNTAALGVVFFAVSGNQHDAVSPGVDAQRALLLIAGAQTEVSPSQVWVETWAATCMAPLSLAVFSQKVSSSS